MSFNIIDKTKKTYSWRIIYVIQFTLNILVGEVNMLFYSIQKTYSSVYLPRNTKTHGDQVSRVNYSLNSRVNMKMDESEFAPWRTKWLVEMP